jgi:hypothetical protein
VILGSGGLNLIKREYLIRVDERKAYQALKTEIVFGLAVGWFLTLSGGFRYLFVPGVNDPLCLSLAFAGLAFLVVTIVWPQANKYPQKLMKAVAGFIGGWLFKGLLTILYFVAVLPVGLIHQWWHGVHPFYGWKAEPETQMEGWVTKHSTDKGKLAQEGGGKLPTFLQPVQVLGYFAREGHFLFIPTLILFLILSVAGFVAQSSSLAPLIYTLF